MRRIQFFILVVLSMVVASSLCFAGEKKFHAKLTPKEEVAGVKSKASGKAEFQLSKDHKSLSYKLHVKNIENATAAHIHAGKKGENGPPLATIFAGPRREGKFSGTLSEGEITDEKLMGSLQGKTVEDLAAQLESGGAYVNVHTSANPDGEIRGQIK